jgi:hypothetical protein
MMACISEWILLVVFEFYFKISVLFLSYTELQVHNAAFCWLKCNNSRLFLGDPRNSHVNGTVTTKNDFKITSIFFLPRSSGGNQQSAHFSEFSK